MKLFIPPTLWYEDADGNRLEADLSQPEPPVGARYQISQFPRELRTTYRGLRRRDGAVKSSYEVATGIASWPEDLVLRMATMPRWAEGDPGGEVLGPYSLSEAILIAATTCERCMNALAHRYGLEWGYPEGSEEWQRARTECHFCKDEHPLEDPIDRMVMPAGVSDLGVPDALG